MDAADASYSSSGEPSELNMTVAVAVLLRRPAGGGGTRARLHGALGRTRERQLFFWPRVYTSSSVRARKKDRDRTGRAPRKRGRPTPRSPRLPASIEDQVGERRRRAIGFIIASSKPSTSSYLERCLEGLLPGWLGTDW